MEQSSQVQQCTASIDEIRCQKPAEGSSDLCKTHRRKCQKLYLDYKNICAQVPDFDYCDIDILQISVNDLSTVVEDLKRKYILFQRCIQARDRHNSVCYVLECRDQNHAVFVQKVINAMNKCDTTLSAVYSRIDQERIRLEEEQRKLNEEQRKLNEVEETTEQVEQMQNIVEKQLTSKKISSPMRKKSVSNISEEKEEEEAFIEAQEYARIQKEEYEKEGSKYKKKEGKYTRLKLQEDEKFIMKL